MVNEMLQWLLLLIICFVGLGILRQVSLLIPSARQVSSGPEVGRRLPRRSLEQLKNALPGKQLSEPTLVAFVTENCVGCQELLADVPRALGELNGSKLLIVPRSPTGPVRQALAELGVPFVADSTDGLWKAAQVTTTPLVVAIDAEGRVLRKEVTHRVDLVAPAKT